MSYEEEDTCVYIRISRHMCIHHNFLGQCPKYGSVPLYTYILSRPKP